MNLARRSKEPEEMDSPATDAQTYAVCLRDLSAVNRVTLTHRPTLRWLARAAVALPRSQAIRILDVACGHGDLLRAIGRWAKRRGIAVQLEGIDLNERSADIARRATPEGLAITYRTGDVFDFTPLTPPDLIVSSQFAHHLDDDEVMQLMTWMDKTACCGWFIADLHRHPLAYYGFPLLARVAGWHRIVRRDGQISVARAFTRRDWENLLGRSGLHADVTWQFPFRYCVSAVAGKASVKEAVLF